MMRRAAVVFGLSIGFAWFQPALATQFVVEIDTTAIQGMAGAIAFDFTSNTQDDNTASILNFSHDGVTGLPETQGGLVEGDIILLLNPAPFTQIQDDSFFNELLVPFISFGTNISFTLQISENAPPLEQLPDQFSFYILGDSRLPIMSTSDPLAVNSLFAIDVDGSATGLLSVFEPTVFTSPDLLEIFVQVGDLDTDGDGVIDSLDQCPSSDLSATVIIDGCDSGIANSLLQDPLGCTILDQIEGALALGGEEVLEDLLEDLEDQGLLNDEEAEDIEDCVDDDDDDDEEDDD